MDDSADTAMPHPVLRSVYFDSVTALEMVRGGRIHVVVLGAYQVDAVGSFAN
jgi:acyl CoA:acetate/3-ketoacid CoA transferase beta subunit